MAIVGVNGINTHGESNIDRLLRAMRQRGFDTVDVRLPKRHWFSARWGAKEDSQRILDHSEEGDILVCHSFGAVRCWYAHKKREYKAIICIAPAHGKHVEWNNPSRVWCYYSPSDWVITLGAFLLFHPFGAAGTDGYTQLAPYGHNIRMESNHNDYFQAHRLERIADHLERIATGLR